MDSVEDVKVRIAFEMVDTDGTRFVDALFLTPEEFANTTAEQLESMKTERFTNWKQQAAAAVNTVAADPIEEAARIDIEIERLNTLREQQVSEAVSVNNTPPEVVEQQIEEKVAEIQTAVVEPQPEVEPTSEVV